MGPVFLNRYDPLAALLTTLALVALPARHASGRPGALLGAGDRDQALPGRLRADRRAARALAHAAPAPPT